MKTGDRAAIFSYDGFHRFVTILDADIPSGINEKTCYITNELSMFYMMPEIGTGKHYNVANKAFWLFRNEKLKEIMSTIFLLERLKYECPQLYSQWVEYCKFYDSQPHELSLIRLKLWLEKQHPEFAN
jgi:hypothetical protein